MATTIRSNTGNGGIGGWLQSMSRRQLVGQILVYILLIAIGFALAVPFLWLVSSSFKTETDAFRIPPSFIPRPVEWGNYATGLTDFPLCARRSTR